MRAIEVTANSVEDAPMLLELLGQIPPDKAVASVSRDGAYDTKVCHAAMVQKGAQAVIPPRKNARACKATLVGSRMRNKALRAWRRLGWHICKKWIGDHRRRLLETQMPCFTQLGRPRCDTSLRLGSGSSRPYFELYNKAGLWCRNPMQG